MDIIWNTSNIRRLVFKGSRMEELLVAGFLHPEVNVSGSRVYFANKGAIVQDYFRH